MKKIMKRLLTGVLTLATVFTALPVTQVHAADSVYTTTDGKAGTIVKIDNGGSEVSSFEESIMNADGQIAYCIDINTNFQSGYKNRINATGFYPMHSHLCLWQSLLSGCISVSSVSFPNLLAFW